MGNRSFLKHALLYGLGSVLTQAGGVLLVPLYTRCLTKADFGALEVLTRCAEMAGTLLLIGGLRQGLMTFYQQSKTDEEREGVFRATMVLLLAVGLLGGGVIMALAGPVCDHFRNGGAQVVSADLLRLAVLAVLLEPLTLMPLALLQARMESATFVVITFSQFVVRVLMCVLLVYGLHWGVAGVFTASAFTAGVYGLGLSLRELLRTRAAPSARRLLDLLRFALPFLPGGLCFFVLQNGDRFFLLHWSGEAAVGVYGLGYKVALAVTTFSLSPLYMVWGAELYRAAEGADAPQVFGRVFTRITAAFMLVGLAACLFQDEAVAVLGGQGYEAAAYVVTPVVLAGLFQTAAGLMDAGFYVRRRTDLKLAITLAATAFILVLYTALIPPFGAAGAALATLCGFGFLAVLTYRETQRIFRVEYEWGRVADLVGLAAGLWLVSRFLPVAGWAVAAKAGLWLLWPLLAWVCGLPSAYEKEYVCVLLRRAQVGLRLAPVGAHTTPPAPEAPAPRTPPAVQAAAQRPAEEAAEAVMSGAP